MDETDIQIINEEVPYAIVFKNIYKKAYEAISS